MSANMDSSAEPGLREKHLLLLVDYSKKNKPWKEPVHVAELERGAFRLLYSPGLVQGIAAGDVFRILNDDGAFELVERSGNLSVQVYCLRPFEAAPKGKLIEEMERFGASLDGQIERGMVFTAPPSAAFGAMEKALNAFVSEIQDSSWDYGNFPDPAENTAKEVLSGSDDHAAELRERRRVWADKPAIRLCYAKWIRMARAWAAPGLTLEVGAGSGLLKEAWGPGLIATDITPTPWIDLATDATRMGVADGAADNVLLVDALHHFNDPHAFIDEAARVTRPGGRLIFIEPWISPASRVGYKALHHEDICFTHYKRPGANAADPWEGNLAMPNIVFGREWPGWPARHPQWRPLVKRRFSFFDFQFAGGFKPWALAPWPVVYKAFLKMDDLLAPLMPLLAFRVFVVLERTDAPLAPAANVDPGNHAGARG